MAGKNGGKNPQNNGKRNGERRKRTPRPHAKGNGRDAKGRFVRGNGWEMRNGDPGLPGAGRPKGVMTEWMREVVKEQQKVSGGAKSRGELLIRAAFAHAAKGNFQYFKEIIDRLDGKVPQRVVGDITLIKAYQGVDLEQV